MGDLAALGAFLREQREKSGMTLEQVAAEIRIAVSRLQAVEAGDIDRFPQGGLYRRALVRSYAAAIGVDPDDAVREFRSVCPESEPALPAPEQFDPHPARQSIKPAWSALAAGLALGAVWLAFNFAIGPPAPVPAQETTVVTPAEVAATTGVEPTPAEAPRIEQPADVGPVYSAPAIPSDVGRVYSEAVSDQAGDPPDAVVARAEDPPPAPPVHASLRVTSTPAGARVTVNGIGWGTTPLTINYLPPGVKMVRVAMDGYQSAERTVELGDGPAAISLTLRPAPAN